MNEDNVAIRLKGFIDSLGLSSSQFADQCGIPRPSLSQLLSGRNKKISDVLVGQIHNAFPQLSVLWLLFGEGDMLVKSDIQEDDLTDSETNKNDSEEIGGVGINISASRESNYRKPVDSIVVSGKLESILAEKETQIEELKKEIERLKRFPRKVAQITVYYDDSTFETFYPLSSGNRVAK